MSKKISRTGEHIKFFFTCIIITNILLCGCSLQINSNLKEANDLFSRGKYKASLSKYEQIIENYPKAEDRVLFEMGIIYAYPWNEQKDYEKSMKCFQRLIKNYPESEYRQNSEVLVSLLNNITVKDNRINSGQSYIDVLEREAKYKENDMIMLQKKIEALEQEVFVFRNAPPDKILIEKKERRLTLISKNKVLKTYKIALGGNPDGAKEKQGDNKTPEGTYFIDSRNKNSLYHLSLHISYPNEKDKKRARELGVPPGGDIMIHGIKKGYGWVGDFHSEIDWTKGCIAVTDEEIEEIEKLVPNGTVVEIKP